MQFGIIVALSVRHKFFVIDGGSGNRDRLPESSAKKSFGQKGV
jgi:hypothetical protein